MEFKMYEHGFKAQFEYGTLTISGDDSEGFRPYTLLVSSVAGCSGLVLRKVLNKMRIPFDDLTISAEVKRNPDEADRVEEIKLHVVITGNDIDEKKVERAMALTHKNCSMVQSVNDSINIVETFEIRS